MDKKKQKIGEELDRKPTPMMDIVFESGLLVMKVRWSIQAIEAIMSEMNDAGFSSGLIEKLSKKFYERVE
jgi:hypothetical protein